MKAKATGSYETIMSGTWLQPDLASFVNQGRPIILLTTFYHCRVTLKESKKGRIILTLDPREFGGKNDRFPQHPRDEEAAKADLLPGARKVK